MSYSTFEITGNTVTFNHNPKRAEARRKAKFMAEADQDNEDYIDFVTDAEYGADAIDVGDEWE